MLLYVVATMFSSVHQHVTHREWDRISMMTSEAVGVDLDRFLDERDTSPWLKCLQYFPLFQDIHYRDECDFKIVELLFKVRGPPRSLAPHVDLEWRRPDCHDVCGALRSNFTVLAILTL